VNPPYGKKGPEKLAKWVEKAYFESQQKDTCVVVMLLPARTNTQWWHKYCMNAYEIKFICGRPKFGNAKHGLPWPLAIVVFKKHTGLTNISSLFLSDYAK